MKVAQLLPHHVDCWHNQNEIDLGNEAFSLLLQIWEARNKPVIDTGSSTNPRYREFYRDFDHIMLETSARMQRALVDWEKFR